MYAGLTTAPEISVLHTTAPLNVASAEFTTSAAALRLIADALTVAVPVALTVAAGLVTVTGALAAVTLTPVSEIVSSTPATVFTSTRLGVSEMVTDVPDAAASWIGPACPGG